MDSATINYPSNIPIKLVVFQVVLHLDGPQHPLLLLGPPRLLHEAKVGHLLAGLLTLGTDVVAGRYLQHPVHADVVVGLGLEAPHAAVEGVEEPRVQHGVDSGLGRGPVAQDHLELRQQLDHLRLNETHVLIEELLDREGAEVEEDREALEDGGAGGLVDVEDVGEHRLDVLIQLLVEVPVQLPLDLAQEVPVEDGFVHVEHHLLGGGFDQCLEGVLEVVLAAEGALGNGAEEGLGLVPLPPHVPPVLPAVLGGADLQHELGRVCLPTALHV